MTEDIRLQRARLNRERDRLAALLARHSAWAALRHLAAQPVPASAVEQARVSRRRHEIERQLAGHPVFEAYRTVSASIGAIEAAMTATPAIRGDEEHGSGRGVVAPEANKDRGMAGGAIVARIHEALPGSERVAVVGDGMASEPDDLTRIRGIDRALAAALVVRGVKRFEQIAAFTSADVRSLAAALSLGRRISRENWIEQAAMLALRRQRATPVLPLAPTAAPSPRRDTLVAGAVKAIVAAVASRSPQRDASPPAIVEVAGPVRGRAEPTTPIAIEAVAQASEVPRPVSATSVHGLVRSAALGIAGRTCGTTEAASQVATEPAMEVTAPEVAVLIPEPAPTMSRNEETEADAAAATADDLTLIYGIDTEIAARLAALRVTRFAQIAAWDAAAVRAMASRLGPPADVYRHGWTGQATILAKGCVTEHMLRVVRGDYAALVPWPVDQAMRNEPFAAWLKTHSHGLGVETGRNAGEPGKPLPLSEAAADVATIGATGAKGSDPRLTIADRITAIERDAARLSIRAQASLRGEAVAAKASRGNSSRDSAYRSPGGNAPHANREPAEAEVRIVMKETHGSGFAGPSGAAGPGRPKAGEAATAASFDKDDYAGYRDQIEEASVTIVRRGPADQSPELSKGPSEAPARPEAGSGVRRFLKALTGE